MMERPATRGTEMSTSRLADQLIAIADGGCNIDVEPDQSIYPRPEWAVDQIVRASGLVENVCKHGIGHPHPMSVKRFEEIGIKSMDVHGCDGCCMPGGIEEVQRAYKEKLGTIE